MSLQSVFWVRGWGGCEGILSTWMVPEWLQSEAEELDHVVWEQLWPQSLPIHPAAFLEDLGLWNGTMCWERVHPFLHSTLAAAFCFEPSVAPCPLAHLCGMQDLAEMSNWILQCSFVQSTLDSMGNLPVEDWIPAMEKTCMGGEKE